MSEIFKLNMDYSILQKIIGDLESFEAEQNSTNISMEDFVGFLNRKYLERILTLHPIEVPAKNDENNIKRGPYYSFLMGHPWPLFHSNLVFNAQNNGTLNGEKLPV